MIGVTKRHSSCCGCEPESATAGSIHDGLNCAPDCPHLEQLDETSAVCHALSIWLDYYDGVLAMCVAATEKHLSRHIREFRSRKCACGATAPVDDGCYRCKMLGLPIGILNLKIEDDKGDPLELAYWDFDDAKSKGLSERDAYKASARKLLSASAIHLDPVSDQFEGAGNNMVGDPAWNARWDRTASFRTEPEVCLLCEQSIGPDGICDCSLITEPDYPEIPDGWRELEHGEPIQAGDKFWSKSATAFADVSDWFGGTSCQLGIVHATHIRRIGPERVKRYKLERDRLSGQMVCEFQDLAGRRDDWGACEVPEMTDADGRVFAHWEDSAGDEMDLPYEVRSAEPGKGPNPADWADCAVFVMPGDVTK